MSHNGVRQGENLSPLLFALYVNDIESFFSLRGSSPINVGDDVIDVYMKMFVLLYADDTVIMANDAESLQSNLHYLSEYCDMWNLSVNTDKTKIVIFSKYKYREKHNFIYKNTTIEIVEHFKYLGVIFNFNNSFVKHKKTPIWSSKQSHVCSVKKKQTVKFTIGHSTRIIWFSCFTHPYLWLWSMGLREHQSNWKITLEVS